MSMVETASEIVASTPETIASLSTPSTATLVDGPRLDGQQASVISAVVGGKSGKTTLKLHPSLPDTFIPDLNPPHGSVVSVVLRMFLT
jgi:hypothetical protein